MNKYSFNFKMFVDIVTEFVTDNGDIFTGNLAAIKSPFTYEEGDGDEISLSDAIKETPCERQEYVAYLHEFYSQLTKDIINAVLVERFYSIPDTYSNSFYKYANVAIYKCKDNDIERWERICALSDHIGDEYTIITADNKEYRVKDKLEHHNLRRLFDSVFKDIRDELNSYLPDNTWLTADVEFTANTVRISTGEDLRHVIFEEQYGCDKWDGAYHLPTGQVIK